MSLKKLRAKHFSWIGYAWLVLILLIAFNWSMFIYLQYSNVEYVSELIQRGLGGLVLLLPNLFFFAMADQYMDEKETNKGFYIKFSIFLCVLMSYGIINWFEGMKANYILGKTIPAGEINYYQ